METQKRTGKAGRPRLKKRLIINGNNLRINMSDEKIKVKVNKRVNE